VFCETPKLFHEAATSQLRPNSKVIQLLSSGNGAFVARQQALLKVNSCVTKAFYLFIALIDLVVDTASTIITTAPTTTAFSRTTQNKTIHPSILGNQTTNAVPSYKMDDKSGRVDFIFFPT